MSASERLRALKPEGIVVADAPYEGYTDWVPVTERLRDLIAELAVAVESVLNEAWLHDENEDGVEWARNELRRPYYALREHLEGGDE